MRTREPGGTEVGVLIRDIVLHHRGEVAPRAEALLYAADRAHHIETVVRPALERGDVVIQDRYLDSSVAYQGAGRVLGRDEVRDLSLWATEGLLPDLTVLLDLDPSLARDRLDADDKPFDRLEAEQSAFHDSVREEFLALAAAEPEPLPRARRVARTGRPGHRHPRAGRSDSCTRTPRRRRRRRRLGWANGERGGCGCSRGARP